MQERKDNIQAKIIEQAVALDAIKGAAHAWAYLTFHGVPHQMVAKVLAESGQRRASHSASANSPALRYSAQDW